jgi:hypothetical protein
MSVEGRLLVESAVFTEEKTHSMGMVGRWIGNTKK